MTVEQYQAEHLAKLDEVYGVLLLLDNTLIWLTAAIFGIIGLLVVHLFFLGKGDQ